MIGYGICGSFCTHERSLKTLEELVEKYDVQPIATPCVVSSDTRFGKASEFIGKVERVTGPKFIEAVTDAEPLGPSKPL